MRPALRVSFEISDDRLRITSCTQRTRLRANMLNVEMPVDPFAELSSNRLRCRVSVWQRVYDEIDPLAWIQSRWRHQSRGDAGIDVENTRSLAAGVRCSESRKVDCS